MSFFGSNEIGSVGNIHIEAADGYSGTMGAQMLMVEGFQSDMDLFVEALITDRQEYRMVKEGAGEEEVLAVQEGALSSFWGKVKEVIKKLIAKVKGIFTGFIAKFEAWMGRDGKAFYDKYKKIIHGPGDLKDCKVKYSKPRISSGDSIQVDLSKVAISSTDATLEDKDNNELVDKMLNAVMSPSLSGTDKKTFRKDYHEACFEDQESHELDNGKIAEYVRFIVDNKAVEAVKKMSAQQEKNLNNYIKLVEKLESSSTNYAIDKNKSTIDTVSGKVEKDAKGGTHNASGENASDVQKRANRIRKQVTALQEVIGIANGAALTEIKFAVAQSRRVAAAIVAYKSKKHEDVSLLAEAEQDSAEYEFLSAMEAVD